METSYIYNKRLLPMGITVEEVTGREDKSGKVWRALATQVWCENGKDGFQALDHTSSGAPLMAYTNQRVSVTHTDRLLAIATLPECEESESLEGFNEKAVLGIDAEKTDRAQVIKIREKFLNTKELSLIPEDSVEENILAWTIKEACYKAALTPGLDFGKQIHILALPKPQNQSLGLAEVILPSCTIRLSLFSYLLPPYIITLAFRQ